MPNIEQLAYSLTKKVPYRKLLNLLNNLNIPTARGKENIINKIIEQFEQGEIDDASFEQLTGAYIEAIQFGDKAVKFFPITEEDLEHIEEEVGNLDLAGNLFQEQYPFLIDEQELANIDNQVYLCDVDYSSEKIVLAYISKRYQKTKVELTERLSPFNNRIDNLNLDSFHEIFGYRMEHHQCFDYVVIDRENLVLEIQTDISNAQIFGESIRDNFHSLVRIINRNFNFEDFQFSEPYNLLENVQRLYDDGSEGKVGELGFITDTSSVKNSKMRRGNEDLRTELFHVGGSEKLSEESMGWDAYKIGIIYQRVDSGKVELFLPGNARTLSPSNQRIDEVWLKGCSSEEDFVFLKSKIIF